MLTGRALQRRAAIAAAIPPLIRLRGSGSDSARALALELGQPERLVVDAVRALEREGWVTICGDQVTLTPKAADTLDGWEAEIAGALR